VSHTTKNKASADGISEQVNKVKKLKEKRKME
jgi:hypothetical protein